MSPGRSLACCCLFALCLSCHDSASSTGPASDESARPERPLAQPDTSVSIDLSPLTASTPPLLPAPDVRALPREEAERGLRRLFPDERSELEPSPFRDGPRPPRPASVEPDLPEAQKASASEDEPDPAFAVAFRAPEGEADSPEEIRVVFTSKVAGIRAGQLARANHAGLLPAINGEWHWLDARTLVFRPAERFPKATAFKVRISGVITSARNEKLESPVEWSFSTPPPRVVETLPSERERPASDLVFVRFDQKVDPPSVLAVSRATVAGQPSSLRLATREELRRDPILSRAAAAAPKEHWIALAPKSRWPAGADVEIAVGPKIPSAEGKLVSETPTSLRFTTGHGLRLVTHHCSLDDGPRVRIELMFEGRIDPTSFSEELLLVEPALRDRDVVLHRSEDGSRLEITGLLSNDKPLSIKLGKLAAENGVSLEAPLALSCEPQGGFPAFSVEHGHLVSADGRLPVWLRMPQRLRVQAYPARPEEWSCFVWMARDKGHRDLPGGLGLLRNLGAAGDKALPCDELGAPGFDRVFDVAPGPDGKASLELAEALKLSDAGAFVRLSRDGQEGPTAGVWLQGGSFLLDAFSVGESLVVLATSNGSGRPVDGIRVSAGAAQATTDASGIAVLPRPKEGLSYVAGTRGAETVHAGLSLWPTQEPEPRWHFFAPRESFAPGTALVAAGWLGGPSGTGLEAKGPAKLGFTLVTQDRDLHGYSKIEHGSFSIQADLPAELREWGTRLVVGPLDSSGGQIGGQPWLGSLPITITAMPVPERELELSTATAPLVAQPLVVRAASSDGALGKIDWQVEATPTRQAIPGLEGLAFGTVRTDWSRALAEDFFRPGLCSQPRGPVRWESRSSTGASSLRVDLVTDRPRSMRVETVARIPGAAQRRAQATIHPAAVTVGLHASRTFLRKGEWVEIEALVTDHDGQRMPGRPIEIEAIGRVWEPRLGGWIARVAETTKCQRESERNPVTCAFQLDKPADYRIVARTSDLSGRLTESELPIFVEGAALPPADQLSAAEYQDEQHGTAGAVLRGMSFYSRHDQRSRVEVFAERERYEPGDSARLLLTARRPGTRVLVLAHGPSGLARTLLVDVEGVSKLLELPIETAFAPSLELIAFEVGPDVRTSEPSRARLEVGKARPSRLALRLDASEQAGVSGGKRVAIQVLDSDGAAVAGAEVVVAAVDADTLDNAAPLEKPEPGVAATRSSPRLVWLHSPAPATDSCARRKPAEDESPLYARDPEVRLVRATTDADGRAQVSLELLPGTRYRLRAMASSPRHDAFGTAELDTAMDAPPSLEWIAPRFARPGDLVRASLLLRNPSGSPLEARLFLRVRGGKLSGARALEVTLPAGEPVALPIEVVAGHEESLSIEAALEAGPAPLRARTEIPVELALRRDAAWGTLSGPSTSQRIKVPARAHELEGGLSIALWPGLEGTLSDAVAWLLAMPGDGTETLASQALALGSLGQSARDLASPAFGDGEALEALARARLETLASRLTAQGFVEGDARRSPVDPFVGIHAAHALQQAHARGFALDAARLDELRTVLRAVRAQLPPEPELSDALEAYALHVRAALGDPDVASARRVASRALEGHSSETLAWLLSTLTGEPEGDQIERRLLSRAMRGGSGTHFTALYREGADRVRSSEHRPDAIVLAALASTRRASGDLDAVTEGLLSHRAAGHWATAQENAFAVAALAPLWSRQAPTARSARVWLGEAFAGEARFDKEPAAELLRIPMGALAATPRVYDLVLAKDGPGPLYYRVELASSDDAESRQDPGYAVERSWVALDDPADVVKDLRAGWRVSTGARLRVRLLVTVPECSRSTVLLDPLPAGLMPVGLVSVSRVAAGGACGSAAPRPGMAGGESGTRPLARVELGDLGRGVHAIEYSAIAVSPGVWSAPPPRLEDAAKVRAIGSADRINVE